MHAMHVHSPIADLRCDSEGMDMLLEKYSTAISSVMANGKPTLDTAWLHKNHPAHVFML